MEFNIFVLLSLFIFFVSRGKIMPHTLSPFRGFVGCISCFFLCFARFLGGHAEGETAISLVFLLLVPWWGSNQIPIRFQWGSNHDGWHTKGNILVSYSSYLLISCITETFVCDALILLPTHTSAYARALKCCTTHQPHRKSMQSKQ